MTKSRLNGNAIGINTLSAPAASTARKSQEGEIAGFKGCSQQGRTRAAVSYGEMERAAIALLKSERRPTIETIREALGRGSPETIGNALKRFWRDLGARIEGDPAALTRMPPDIADLADGMWQRALKLAGEAAVRDDNAARERLEQIQVENELKAQSFALREAELDASARAREKALADTREHLLVLMKTLSRDQAIIRARDTRIEALEAEIEQYRQQLAKVLANAVERSRALAERKRPVPAAKRKRPARKTPNRSKRKLPRPKRRK